MKGCNALRGMIPSVTFKPIYKWYERGWAMELKHIILLSYLVIMNIVGVAVMGIDKGKAKKGAWRIKEKTLFLVSFIGGSIGTLLGMYMFRHKTKHIYFVIGMPLILIFHIGIAVFLFIKGIL